MELNHIDLPVADIAGVRDFFVAHFGFRTILKRDDGLAVLLDESNFALTLSALIPGEAQRYPSGFHVGFNLNSEAQVRAAHDRLVAEGVEIVRPLGDLGGALTFHCVAPGALLVELAWRTRQAPGAGAGDHAPATPQAYREAQTEPPPETHSMQI